MSTATELAELEAAIAENELADDEGERLRELVNEGVELPAALDQVIAGRAPDLGPPDETPPTPPEPTAADLKAFERENSRHERELRKIMGADFDTFEPCDTCGGVGYAPAGPPPPQPQGHDYFKACETCNGYGLVLTGSVRAGNESRDCPTCRGRGYLEKLNEQGAPLAGAEASAAAVPIIPPPPADANGTQTPAGERFGVPAWMGDTNLGQ